jgi:hypothetical protein
LQALFRETSSSLDEATVVLAACEEVHEILDLSDLLVWKRADLLEKILFSERISHDCILTYLSGRTDRRSTLEASGTNRRAWRTVL